MKEGRRRKKGGSRQRRQKTGGMQNDARLIPAFTGKYSLPHWIAAYVPRHRQLFTWKVLLCSEPTSFFALLLCFSSSAKHGNHFSLSFLHASAVSTPLQWIFKNAL